MDVELKADSSRERWFRYMTFKNHVIVDDMNAEKRNLFPRPTRLSLY